MNHLMDQTVAVTLSNHKSENVIANKRKYRINQPSTVVNHYQIINLWQFLQLYTLGNVPIIHIICGYLILTLFNRWYLHCSEKYVLLIVCLVIVIINVFAKN